MENKDTIKHVAEHSSSLTPEQITSIENNTGNTGAETTQTLESNTSKQILTIQQIQKFLSKFLKTTQLRKKTT